MRLRFLGHACFALETATGARLCIDPFESGGLAGAVTLPPIPDEFDAWIATHEHGDHSAGHTLPSASRLTAPCEWHGISIEVARAWHDEFGGRLRGGDTAMLRFSDGMHVVVHVGDLGERPVGATLEWLTERPIDVLILPVGGYFTLGPDGAAELAALLRPRWVVPCHAREHGVALPQLGSAADFQARLTPAAVSDPLVASIDARVFELMNAIRT